MHLDSVSEQLNMSLVFCLVPHVVVCKAYETNERGRSVKQYKKNRAGHGRDHHAEILSKRGKGRGMLQQQVKCLVNSGSLADIKNYVFFISRAP